MLNFSLEYVYEQYARIPACPVNWGYRLLPTVSHLSGIPPTH